MKRQIQIHQRLLPKKIVYHLSNAVGFRCQPMLVTFTDLRGNLRHERVAIK